MSKTVVPNRSIPTRKAHKNSTDKRKTIIQMESMVTIKIQTSQGTNIKTRVAGRHTRQEPQMTDKDQEGLRTIYTNTIRQGD